MTVDNNDFMLVASLLLSPGENPYPSYEVLRERGPIRHGLGSGWLLSRFDDVLQVLRDERFGQLNNAVPDGSCDPVLSFLSADPPQHERLRKAAAGFFTPPAISSLKPGIEQTLEDLFEKAVKDGGLDVVPDLAGRLSSKVVAQILGVPAELCEELRIWSSRMWVLLEPPIDGEAIALANETVGEAQKLFSTLSDQRRLNPSSEDLVGVLTAMVDAGELTQYEMLSICTTIMIAAQETTVNLISNGTSALAKNKDKLAQLKENPALTAKATDELLRYDSPIQILARRANDSFELGGIQFERGDTTILLLGAANRDPSIFPNPDELDFNRPNSKRHIGFGGGIHLCIGAFLARTLAEQIFSRIAQTEDLEISDAAVRRPTVMLRGYESLPVSFH